MTDHFKISDYVGARVLNQAKQTRLWALACALDHALYAADIQPRADGLPGKMFAFPLDHEDRLWLGNDDGWAAHHFPWVTKPDPKYGYYADVGPMLREIVHELERLAVFEVTQ